MVAGYYNENEARCPISPDGAPYQYSHGVTSPSNNSDNNFYQSPALSPGNWNVASPGSIVSPYSSNASWRSFDSSVQGSPLSAPAALASSATSSSAAAASSNDIRPPRLPSELGNTDPVNMEKKAEADRRLALEKVNKRFIAKSTFDQEREKNAIRKANSLMNVTHGRTETVETKKIMITNKKPVGRVVIVPDGREHMASSSWKARKTANGNDQQKSSNDDPGEFEEHVDDFKCELDREREKWAQKQALRMVKGANNFL